LEALNGEVVLIFLVYIERDWTTWRNEYSDRSNGADDVIELWSDIFKGDDSFAAFKDACSRECDDCISEINTHNFQYIHPMSLDYVLQSKLKIKLDVNEKVSITGFYDQLDGIGSGTDNFVHHKDYETGVYVPTTIENEYHHRSIGAEVNYQHNEHFSFFFGAAYEKTKDKYTIKEDDLDRDVTTTTSEYYENEDGSSGVIKNSYTEHRFDKGHEETFSSQAKRTKITAGMRYTW